MDNQDSKVIEFVLPGVRLEKETTDLEKINEVGRQLYEQNKKFIKEKIRDNWYAVIEPLTGTFIASEDINLLYKEATAKFPNKLFYVLGLIKNLFHHYGL